jgi:hypothetical protein
VKEIAQNDQLFRGHFGENGIEPLEVRFGFLRRGNSEMPEGSGFAEVRVGDK